LCDAGFYFDGSECQAVPYGFYNPVAGSVYYTCQDSDSGICTPTLYPTALSTSSPTEFPTAASTAGNCSSCATCGLNATVEFGVTSIRPFAFEACSTTSLTLPTSVTTIGEYACSAAEFLSVVKFNIGLRIIGIGAFRSTHLVTIELPLSLENISAFAFESCKLSSVSIPDSVTYLGYGSFYFNPLSNITFGSGLSRIGSIAFAESTLLEFVFFPSNIRTIGEGAFLYCLKLTTVVFSEGLVNIEPLAFAVTGLRSLSIPSTVLAIGQFAFYGNPLVTVNLFDGLQIIGNGTFALNFNLREVEIPSTVSTIGYQAFYGCSNLTTVVLNEGLIHIGELAFCGTNVTVLVVPSSVVVWNRSEVNFVCTPTKVIFATALPTASPTRSPTLHKPTVVPTYIRSRSPTHPQSDCPPGSYRNTESVSCSICPTQTYTAEYNMVGEASCVFCGVASSTLTGAASCYPITYKLVASFEESGYKSYGVAAAGSEAVYFTQYNSSLGMFNASSQEVTSLGIIFPSNYKLAGIVYLENEFFVWDLTNCKIIYIDGGYAYSEAAGTSCSTTDEVDGDGLAAVFAGNPFGMLAVSGSGTVYVPGHAYIRNVSLISASRGLYKFTVGSFCTTPIPNPTAVAVHPISGEIYFGVQHQIYSVSSGGGTPVLFTAFGSFGSAYGMVFDETFLYLSTNETTVLISSEGFVTALVGAPGKAYLTVDTNHKLYVSDDPFGAVVGLCDPGYFFNGTECEETSPGTYNPVVGSVAYSCPSAEGFGSTECASTCSPGTFAATVLDCVSCPGGTYAAANATECTACVYADTDYEGAGVCHAYVYTIRSNNSHDSFHDYVAYAIRANGTSVYFSTVEGAVGLWDTINNTVSTYDFVNFVDDSVGRHAFLGLAVFADTLYLWDEELCAVVSVNPADGARIVAGSDCETGSLTGNVNGHLEIDYRGNIYIPGPALLRRLDSGSFNVSVLCYADSDPLATAIDQDSGYLYFITVHTMYFIDIFNHENSTPEVFLNDAAHLGYAYSMTIGPSLTIILATGNGTFFLNGNVSRTLFDSEGIPSSISVGADYQIYAVEHGSLGIIAGLCGQGDYFDGTGCESVPVGYYAPIVGSVYYFCKTATSSGSSTCAVPTAAPTSQPTAAPTNAGIYTISFAGVQYVSNINSTEFNSFGSAAWTAFSSLITGVSVELSSSCSVEVESVYDLTLTGSPTKSPTRSPTSLFSKFPTQLPSVAPTFTGPSIGPTRAPLTRKLRGISRNEGGQNEQVFLSNISVIPSAPTILPTASLPFSPVTSRALAVQQTLSPTRSTYSLAVQYSITCNVSLPSAADSYYSIITAQIVTAVTSGAFQNNFTNTTLRSFPLISVVAQPTFSAPIMTFHTVSPTRPPSKMPTRLPSSTSTQLSTTVLTAFPTQLPTAMPTLGTFSLVVALDTLTISVSRLNATVHAAFSESAHYGGNVFCMVQYSTAPTPTSVSQVIVNNRVTGAFTSYSSNVTVLLNGLLPLTKYDVYCAVSNSYGYISSLASVISTRASFATVCCKSIGLVDVPAYVSLSSATNSYLLRFQTALSSAPSQKLQLVPSFFSSENRSHLLTSVRMSSSSVNFTSASPSLSYTFYVELNDISVSSLYLTVSAVGTSQAEYASVTYANNPILLFKSNSFSLPAPTLDSANFLPSGSSVVFAFSDATDYAASSATSVITGWPCSLLFIFTSAASSNCVWANSSAITMTFPSSSSLLNYDAFVLPYRSAVTLMGGLVRAACISGTNCTINTATPQTTLTFGVLGSPMKPTVVVQGSNNVTDCEDYILDASASFGSGGREWKTVTWSVSVQSINSEVLQSVKNISKLLDATPLNVYAPILIPQKYLVPSTLTFSLQLTNYLGVMSTGSLNVKVMAYTTGSKVPILLSLIGSSSIARRVSTTTVILANVSFSSCANDKTKLEYLWTVVDLSNSNEVYAGGGNSDNPLQLNLAPYSLLPRHTYAVTVQASSETAVSTAASLTVFMLDDVVKAMVAGGYNRTASVDKELLLDGSVSRDYNVVADLQILSYIWTCRFITASSNWGKDCGLFVDGFVSADGSK
jgi:hypothetical protein